MSEYAIVGVGRGVSIHTTPLIQRGFNEPADAMDYILGLGLTECQVIAMTNRNGSEARRFLDGYEQAAINRSLRLEASGGE